MRYHHQNLTDGHLPLWRHGRAWWGRLNWEWCVLYHPRFGLRIGKGEDQGLTASVSLLLFSLYLRWSCRVRRSRELSLSVYDSVVWLKLWKDPDGDWRSYDPWWRKSVIALHVVDWILGEWKHESTDRDLGDVLVPMPEGCYVAQAKETKRVWRRRFGIINRRTDVSLTFEVGIPCAGKGENSWDCGDDGLYGCGGDTLEKAIGNAVASSLASRRKHGYDSKGTGRVPAVLVQA